MNLKAPAWYLFISLALAISFEAGDLHASSSSQEAAALHEMYDDLRDQLKCNQFGQPIHLSSELNDRQTNGQLCGIIEHPFEIAAPAFKSIDNWCEIMMLHQNVKYCRARREGEDQVMTLFIGRKYYRPLESAHQGEFIYRITDNDPDYLRLSLTSDSGPYQTRNYKIMIEAVPADNGRTFFHLTYAYEFNALTNIAQTAYFNTFGREKVGFTVVSNCPDGRPVHIGGVRGALERNIMRYYLAIKAYLNTLDLPPSDQLSNRLKEWFALTEQYPLQLRELDQAEYMTMKLKEHERRETKEVH